MVSASVHPLTRRHYTIAHYQVECVTIAERFDGRQRSALAIAGHGIAAAEGRERAERVELARDVLESGSPRIDLPRARVGDVARQMPQLIATQTHERPRRIAHPHGKLLQLVAQLAARPHGGFGGR